jgi:hypothetical protein
MKTIKAVIITIVVVALPYIVIPFMQWYEKTFCNPNTDLSFVCAINVSTWVGLAYVCVTLWMDVLYNKK